MKLPSVKSDLYSKAKVFKAWKKKIISFTVKTKNKFLPIPIREETQNGNLRKLMTLIKTHL